MSVGPIPVEIPLVDLGAVNAPDRQRLRTAFEEVLDTSDFCSGEQVARFEQELGDLVVAAHAVGVASGTSALSLGLTAAGVGPGDEVLVPANTFFATASAVVAAGAIPVAVEIERRTGLIDLDAAAAAVTKRTAALAVVHLYGNPVDMSAARRLASRHALLLVDDAAQALGATWRGRPVGSLADLSAFSFYPTKTLGALGQGGAVTTNRPEIARSVRQRREQGCSAPNVHATWAGNERLHGMQAAFLRVKLQRFPAVQLQRSIAAARYDELLQTVPEVRRFETTRHGCHAHHLYAVAVEHRDQVRTRLREGGIETGVHYPTPVHRQPVWASIGTVPELPEADRHAASTMSLPFWPGIGEDQIGRVVDALAGAVGARAAREDTTDATGRTRDMDTRRMNA